MSGSPPRKPRDRNFVKVGNVRVRWHRAADGRTFVDARRYGRKLCTFRDHEEALLEARRIAIEVNSGGIEAAILSPADRAAWAKIVEVSQARGVDPLRAIAEWDECRRLIDGHHFGLATAVEAGSAALKKPIHSIGSIVAELLASRSAEDFDGRTERDLRKILAAFVTDFPGDIAGVTPKQIETWLGSRLKRGKHLPLSAKRRNHIHAAIISLFKFARNRGYLPDVASAAQRIERLKVPRAPIDYFTPVEMIVILKHIEEAWLPWPVLVGFCAMRVEEIALGNHAAARKDCLRWEDFDWHEREIVVREAVAKTGRPRRIPIPENALAWLAPWLRKHGPVLPHGDIRGRLENYRERFKARMAKTAAETDEISPRLLRWPQNALRHSYGSYRMAVTKNAQQVSNEMGDSPAMIHRHYDNPRPMSQANAWWSIFPESAARVSQLILKFEVPA